MATGKPPVKTILIARDHICCKLSCGLVLTKTCSACKIDGYCSVECQESDWKIHKILCPLLKSTTITTPTTKGNKAVDYPYKKDKEKL